MICPPRASSRAHIPAFSAIAVLVAMAGCSTPAWLTHTPFELGPEPMVVPFDTAVPAQGPVWEMCFEFEHARDSDRAGDIAATLITTTGQRHPLIGGDLDRRGERLMCQIVLLDAPAPAAAETFSAVELWSPSQMKIRRLFGRSYPATDSEKAAG